VSMLWLSGCASTTISSCPPIRIYGPATQERIVAQMQALPPADTDLQVFLLDAVALRDAVRACYAATGRPLPAPVGN
jgi:hypothetical protein